MAFIRLTLNDYMMVAGQPERMPEDCTRPILVQIKEIKYIEQTRCGFVGAGKTDVYLSNILRPFRVMESMEEITRSLYADAGEKIL